MAASSLVAEGQSLLEHAGNIVQRVGNINAAVNREVQKDNFTAGKRLMFDMLDVIEPRDSGSRPTQPGLRKTIGLAREHTQLATQASDASVEIQEEASSRTA